MDAHVPHWVLQSVRWTGRITALILAGFLVMFIVGEGPPPLYVLLPWLAVLGGFFMGWRHEIMGGLMILAGFIYFNLQELAFNGHLLRFGAFHLLLIPSLLYLFAGVLPTSRRNTAPGM